MDVFAEDVELDVDDGAGVEIVEVGDLVGVGDDGDGEHAGLAVDDSEADAVDADAALGDSDAGGVGGVVLEIETPAAVVVDDTGAGGCLVDMALDDVAV